MNADLPMATLCDRYDDEVSKLDVVKETDEANAALGKVARIRGLIEEAIGVCMANIRILPIPENVASIAYVEAWLRRRGGWK